MSLAHTQTIRQLVDRSLYAIDEHALAEAIIARAITRRLAPGTIYRNDTRPERVRSFRRSQAARSFRPCDTRRPLQLHR